MGLQHGLPIEPREAGVTLLELMTVVTLIAVVAAAAAPSIGDALAERKMTQTSLDVVRIARRGRSEAAGYGRAHMLRYLSGDTGTGVFELYRGINNHCNTNDWNAVTGGGVCNREGGFCRDFIVVSQETDTDTIAVVPDNIVGEPLDICFEPSGRVLWRTGTNRFSDRNQGGAANPLGGFVFRVERDGGATGVIRRVVIPLGGDARVLQ